MGAAAGIQQPPSPVLPVLPVLVFFHSLSSPLRSLVTTSPLPLLFSPRHHFPSSPPLLSSSPLPLFPSSSLLSSMSIHPPIFRKLNDNRLAGTIPAAITILTNLAYLHLDNNQLTGELPSFHHITHLTSLHRLSAAYNYLTATADAFPFNTTSPDPDDPSGGHSSCVFTHNCLEWVYCGHGLNQRRDSECRAFCGVQVQPLREQRLTPPCSGHGVCSLVPDPSHAMSPCDEDEEFWPPHCEPVGQCTCDDGYTPGTAAGTCVSHDTLLVPQGTIIQSPTGHPDYQVDRIKNPPT
ncbi:unnamed protein product, partial [Closterium sp. NIES-65]